MFKRHLPSAIPQFSEFINEVRYEDYFSENFVEFQKRYTKAIRRKEVDADQLYVQFTSFDPDQLSRNPFMGSEETPHDHEDPSAVYAYPLKYVLNYPSDIWYASQSTYIRVLKDTSKNKLILPHIDEYHFNAVYKSQLRSIYPDVDHAISLALDKKNAYLTRYQGTNKWAKVFFGLVQVDYNAEPHERSTLGGMKIEYPIRNNNEQREIFLKMGYDAIEDISKTNKSAVINDREPEQIAFFTRYAFEVVEVLRINADKKNTNVSDDLSNSRISRKIANTIAEILDGDKLSEGPERMNLGGKEYYWTKGGRHISLYFNRPAYYYDDKKIGEKKHKEYKNYNSQALSVFVESEYGRIEASIPDDGHIKDLYQQITTQWEELKTTKDVPTDWEPLSKAVYTRQQKEKSNRFYQDEEIVKFNKFHDPKRLKATLDAFTSYLNLPEVTLPAPTNEMTSYSTANGQEYEYSYDEYAKYKVMDSIDTIVNSGSRDSTIRGLFTNGVLDTPKFEEKMADLRKFSHLVFEKRLNRNPKSKQMEYNVKYYNTIGSQIKDLIPDVITKVILEYASKKDNQSMFFRSFLENELRLSGL